MKTIITILLVLFSLTSFSQKTWVNHGGHWFLKQGNDSTHYGEDVWSSMPPIKDSINARQPPLVSGANVKTINGASVLGSGNIVVGSATQYFRVVNANATTTGQALVDVTGLVAPLEANSVYEFEAVMSASTSAVTTGIQYGVQFSAAGATIEAGIVGASSTTATKAERISALNTPTTAFLASSAQNGAVRIHGTITVGANAGSLSIRHLKLTSGTSTIFIGSFLKVTKIQ